MKLPRRVPLPWQYAKSAQEDIEALERHAALLNSPSFFPGSADPSFLKNQDQRAERLRLDCLKPEMLLQAAAIKHALVVFASSSLSMPSPGGRLTL